MPDNQGTAATAKKKVAAKKQRKAQQSKFARLTESKKVDHLAKQVQNKLAWDTVEDRWYQFLTGHWKRVSPSTVTRAVKGELTRLIPDGYTIRLIDTMIRGLKIELAVDEWNSTRDLLPMKNGMLNLETMQLEPSKPDHRFRWQLPYDYAPSADCPTIKSWLLESLEGDEAMVDVVRASMYFTIRYDPEIQKMAEAIGPGGTGKSALARLLVLLVGKENSVSTDLKNLENNRFETARLYGKRLGLINDADEYGGAVSNLKAATGGDPLRYEKKQVQQEEDFISEAFMWLIANQPIKSNDYSSGLSRRRVPIRFNRRVTDDDKAKWVTQGGIEAVMQQELPGLLNWVLELGQEGAKAALSESNKSLRANQLEHTVATNPMATWFEEHCVLVPGEVIYTGRGPKSGDSPEELEEMRALYLYPNYIDWCQGAGHHPVSMQKFGENLEDLLTNNLKLPVKRRRKTAQGRPFEGMTLRDGRHDDLPTPVLMINLTTSTDIEDEYIDKKVVNFESKK